MNRVALGKRIRESRKKMGLTQDALSERAGITLYYLGELERGEKTPGLDVLISISNALNVSCDYLLLDSIDTSSVYVDSYVSKKLSGLTNKQKAAVEAIIDAYIKSL